MQRYWHRVGRSQTRQACVTRRDRQKMSHRKSYKLSHACIRVPRPFCSSSPSGATRRKTTGCERVKSLFDARVTKYIIIVFTRGDDLKREGKSIEDVLSTAPDNFRAVLRECGHRYVVFDNTARDKQPQVDRLLQEVRRLRHTHAGKPYTCPRYAEVGEKLEEELRRRLQAVEEKELKRKKYVQELEEKMKRGRELAETEKRDFERKEAEREKTARKMEEERERKMADLLQRGQEQRLSAEKQKEEEKKLHKRMQQEREADRKRELEITENRKEEKFIQRKGVRADSRKGG